uniref:PTBP1-like RNA recognition motif 2 domain-containing protein n=1 Tax=Oryza punctata TaxID=4537 RepID=A0A0E0JKE9_ORYPU
MEWERNNMVSELPIRRITSQETRWASYGGDGDFRCPRLCHGGVGAVGAHQVFVEMPSQLGVAVRMLVADAWRMKAIVWFRASSDAETAQSDLHGHNIYDGGCLLDVQHVPTLLGDRANTAPTKCSTPVPSCAITKLMPRALLPH